MITAATLALIGPLQVAWAGDAPRDVMPDRHWDVVHLHLDVRIDPTAGTVHGSTTHTVAPLHRRQRWLRLHQAALQIESVAVDGEQVEGWHLGQHSLDIPMPPRGEQHEVTVTYRAEPKLGLHFRRPTNSADPVLEAWSQGEPEHNRYWFPSWDHPSDRFTYSGRIEAPSELHVVSNGVLTNKQPTEDGFTAWTYQLDQQLVNYLVMAAVGDYEVESASHAGVVFEYIAPRGTNMERAVELFDDAVPNLSWLQTMLGTPYPFPIYRQIAVSRFLWGGMENSTSSIIALRYVPQVEGDREPSWGRTVVSHELTHQWFGDLLTCYGWRELWLNEGFADYYQKRYQEIEQGPHAAAVWAVNNRNTGLRGSWAMSPNGYTYNHRDNHGVYARGAAFLRFLQLHLGRDAFDAGVRSYVADNADRLVETHDLRRALEDASGQHLGWAFDAFVHSPTLPSATSTWTWDDDTLTLTLTPTTKDEVVAHVPVRVEVGLSDGVRSHTLWLGAEPTRFHLPTRSRPLYVAVDADAGPLVSWTHEQTTDEWAAQLQRADSLPARVVAMKQLAQAEQATDKAVSALIAVVDDHQLHPDYVREAIAALGKLGTAATIDRLLAAGNDPRRPVREASIDALADVPAETKVLTYLEHVMRSSDDPIVRASALQALSKHRPDTALKLARKRLRRPDHSTAQVEHSVAIAVIGSRGERQDLRTAVRFLSPDHQPPTRHAALAALPQLARNLAQNDDWRAVGSAALFEQLDDPDYRVRGAVISALSTVGDAAAEARLRAWARTDPTPLSHAAQRSAATIRGRLRAAGEPVPAEELLGDELGVTERLDTLEQRLERLEQRY